MTNYHLKPITLPSVVAQEAKGKRRKQLEEVRKRRLAIAKARREKEQRAYQQDEEYRKYVDYSG